MTLTADGDVQDIYRELFFHFPQINNAGGFKLLRVPEGGGKQVEVIAAPEAGYSVSYLGAVVHHAKVFIRPLQKDLSLEPLKEEVCKRFCRHACYYLCRVLLTPQKKSV